MDRNASSAHDRSPVPAEFVLRAHGAYSMGSNSSNVRPKLPPARHRRQQAAGGSREGIRAADVFGDAAILLASGVEVGKGTYDRETVLSFIGDPNRFAHLARGFETVVRKGARELDENDRLFFDAASNSLKQQTTPDDSIDGTARQAGERAVGFLKQVRQSGWTMPEIGRILKSTPAAMYTDVRLGTDRAEPITTFMQEIARGEHPWREDACDHYVVSRAWLDWRRSQHVPAT